MTDIIRKGQESTDALAGKLNFEQGSNRIVGRDENNFVKLLINASNDDFSMKVAKDGFDATTAADNQLVFNSNDNTLKVVGDPVDKVITHSGGQSFMNFTYPHSLGYVPIILAYQSYTLGPGLGGRQPLPLVEIITSSGLVSLVLEGFADANNVTFNLTTPNLSGGNIRYTFGYDIAIRYYLLRERASN